MENGSEQVGWDRPVGKSEQGRDVLKAVSGRRKMIPEINGVGAWAEEEGRADKYSSYKPDQQHC